MARAQVTSTRSEAVLSISQHITDALDPGMGRDQSIGSRCLNLTVSGKDTSVHPPQRDQGRWQAATEAMRIRNY
jgi:hypothetical protein